METLDGSSWDVVVAGTGLQPALLALALSRSGKKILHLDSNDYYGGLEAALSLSEADTWAQECNNPAIRHAAVNKFDQPAEGSKLGSLRAYSLSLNPCLLHTRSALLPALVSSRAHEQLEFLAVGSWYVANAGTDSFMRVPNRREDIFSDTSLNLRTKSALVKFLRFVATYQDEDKITVWQPYRDQPFADFLTARFKIQPDLQGPVLALTMATQASGQIQTELALRRIHRHLTSMGVFGAGFSAVLPKYGGLSEVVQVACRAAAVGGAVYVLNRKIEGVSPLAVPEDGRAIKVVLSDNESVMAAQVFATNDQLPDSMRTTTPSDANVCSRTTMIANSALSKLFPPPTGTSPPPSAAVVVIPSNSLKDISNDLPIHILVHSADTGECPKGQSILYATTSQPLDMAGPVLDEAVKVLLADVDPQAAVLWRMRYEVHSDAPQPTLESITGIEGCWRFVPPPAGPMFDDNVLDSVRSAWEMVTRGEGDFLRFSDRNAQDQDEDDDE